jgi:hypothetical protein
MREFLHKLKVWDMDRNDEWLDISMTDTSPKGLKSLREWRFSFNVNTHQYYAVLYRADDEESPFNCGIDLPKAMTDRLWFLAAPQIALWRLTR